MNVADPAPDFELSDQYGTPRRLSALLDGGYVVLFFYPAAMTPGCTAESCHFRDLTKELAEFGARPVGISADPVDKQRTFAETHSLDFPLLSDPDGAVAKRYDARRTGLLANLAPTRRRTFVIGPEQRIVHQVSSEVRMQAHADQALKALRNQRDQDA
ncbi:peroxiredoxin Q/BCP [Lipingzhangella halophila]|uniref:thioredoxin-dependent peroxiredoxin n=1 Tax=Lipingzhangella halophila TaxID=1783352 RepID=A0A7W7RKA6_9ACTN|nr:peroxiredoxin [Lipingzhangella halophila]MBB4933071.1 peroxiredoxin Q/BCP [Lipingzhangella halophila]